MIKKIMCTSRKEEGQKRVSQPKVNSTFFSFLSVIHNYNTSNEYSKFPKAKSTIPVRKDDKDTNHPQKTYIHVCVYTESFQVHTKFRLQLYFQLAHGGGSLLLNFTVCARFLVICIPVKCKEVLKD